MTLLVVGAAGFVGTNFLLRIADQPGLRVKAVYRGRKPTVQGRNITWIQADVRDQGICRELVAGVDQVFMFGGRLATTAILKRNPLGPLTENVMIHLHMLEAAYQGHVKSYVWLSSTTGYPLRSHPLEEEEFFSEDPPAPYESVGWTARYIEKIGGLYAQRSNGRMAVASLRPTGIYGPHDDFNFETCHALPALLRRVVERHKPIEVWGSGEDKRDYVYVDDVVDACLSAADCCRGSVDVNIGSGRTNSLNEILQIMLQLASYAEADIHHRGDMGLAMMTRAFSCQKAHDLMKFQAKTSLENGLRLTMDWYRKSLVAKRTTQVLSA